MADIMETNQDNSPLTRPLKKSFTPIDLLFSRVSRVRFLTCPRIVLSSIPAKARRPKRSEGTYEVMYTLRSMRSKCTVSTGGLDKTVFRLIH